MPVDLRWVQLFVATRLGATATAVVLLAVHRVTDHDPLLVWTVVVWGLVTAWAATRPFMFSRAWAWTLDGAVALGLIGASGDYRSPFYLLALSTLAAPAAALPLRRALAWGGAFTVAYFGLAILTGLDFSELGTRARLDSLVTHLLLPLVATGGVAYTAEALRRLAIEQRRAQRLAVETERRRIAWELHDSAKQRLHAAALMLSAVAPAKDGDEGAVLTGALEQLHGATADMETSIAELRAPLEGRPLEVALQDRATELRELTSAELTVSGSAPHLPSVTATHAYRIVAEAMTNAVRHSSASSIRVELAVRDGALSAEIVDDGSGMPARTRPGAGGLLTMRSRAFAIGGRLTVDPGPGGRGTRVSLEVPLPERSSSA